jgi:integrase/recombinase XerD
MLPGGMIGAFLSMLAAERGAAANTIEAYRRDLTGAQAIVGDLAPPIAKPSPGLPGTGPTFPRPASRARLRRCASSTAF